MIAACPKCSTRYRVDPEKLGADGARLRCTKCEAVFRVRAPANAKSDAVSPAPQPQVVPQAPEPDAVSRASQSDVVPDPPQLDAVPPAPQPATYQVARSTSPAFTPPSESPVESARTVVVADPDVEAGKRTAAAIAEWGLHPVLVHDGVEAILAIQRNLPAVAVIDAALPKMFGFQVCEMVKRNESLQSIQVVLVGAIHHADRYRREPSELYGADAYLEHPDLPNGLVPFLVRFGLIDGEPTSQAAPDPIPSPPPEPLAVAPAPQPQAIAPPTPEPEPIAIAPPPEPVAVAPPPAPVADAPKSVETAQAERLARIIVSDIVLYHPEKFEAAAEAGNVAQAMESDLAEGRALFNQRVDASVRDERDFLMEELERVAAERSK